MAMDYATLEMLSPVIVAVSALGIGGWILNNWMRMRHGYPLENSWGKPVYPKSEDEAQGRIQLLTQENAQLRAEVGAMKDRMAVLERIVTDRGFDVAHQIEALREPRREVVKQ